MPWIKIIFITLFFGLALHFVTGALQPRIVEECGYVGWVNEGSSANIGDKSCYNHRVGFSIGYPRYAIEYIEQNPCNGSDYIESHFILTLFLINVLIWNGLAFLLSFFFYKNRRKESAKLNKGKLTAAIITSLIILGIYVLVISFIFSYIIIDWAC